MASNPQRTPRHKEIGHKHPQSRVDSTITNHKQSGAQHAKTQAITKRLQREEDLLGSCALPSSFFSGYSHPFVMLSDPSCDWSRPLRDCKLCKAKCFRNRCTQCTPTRRQLVWCHADCQLLARRIDCRRFCQFDQRLRARDWPAADCASAQSTG